MTQWSSWRLEKFGDAIDDWKAAEAPPDPMVALVIRWTLTRQDDPYVGVLREPGFDNLWFGGIPGTTLDDEIVTCSYWIFDHDHVVQCNGYARLSLPP